MCWLLDSDEETMSELMHMYLALLCCLGTGISMYVHFVHYLLLVNFMHFIVQVLKETLSYILLIQLITDINTTRVLFLKVES